MVVSPKVIIPNQMNALKCREPSPALMQMSTCAYLIITCGIRRACHFSDLIDNMAMGKVSTRCHIFTHKHFSTNPHILSSGYHVLHLFMPLFCCTSVSSRLCTLNFYILQIYEQSESPVPSRTNLSCRRAGLPTLCKDLEL